MWPARDVADWLFSISNISLIVGLVLSAVSTIGVVWMANVREGYLNADLAKSNDQIAHAITSAGEANERASVADQKGAEAQARAAEATQKANEADLARVQLEEKLAARRLTKGQLETISEKMKEWATLPNGEHQNAAVFAYPPSFESSSLTEQLLVALGGAEWSLNRNVVTYGLSPSIPAISGIGILVPISNRRAHMVAAALVSALRAEGLNAGIMEPMRTGCEEIPALKDGADTEPACSSISVFVGDHPPITP